jgi:hypothetical protein
MNVSGWERRDEGEWVRERECVCVCVCESGWVLILY